MKKEQSRLEYLAHITAPLKQSEVAKLCMVDTSNVWRWFNGKANVPPLVDFIRISDVKRFIKQNKDIYKRVKADPEYSKWI